MLMIEYKSFVVYSEEFNTVADFKNNIIELFSKVSNTRTWIMCSSEISWNTYKNLVSGDEESAKCALDMILWGRKLGVKSLETIMQEQSKSFLH